MNSRARRSALCATMGGLLALLSSPPLRSETARRTTRPTPSPSSARDPRAALRAFEEVFFPRSDAAQAGVVVEPQARPPRRHSVAAARPTTWKPPRALEAHPRRDLPPGRVAGPPWLSRLELPDLPFRWNSKIQDYLDFYRTAPKGRALFAALLQRMGRYDAMIRAKLAAHNMPQALIYVAMIESAFDPRRTSYAGAAGLWQFMRPTGRSYGLRRDHWIDERRNPERSTDAALRYLANLYRRLGTWELALAAYNAGFGAVVEAIQKYNTNDYWQLCAHESGLPWATTLYVPKILAAAIVGLNRTAFGFDRVAAAPPLQYELVAVPTSTTIAQLALAAGTEPRAMELLNPELRRGRTPPRGRVWVRIPSGRSTQFYAELARLKGGAARHRPYQVRLGDTLDGIAERFALSPRSLRRLNHLRQATDLRVGMHILVPSRIAKRSEDRRHARPARVSSTPDSDEPTLVALPADVPTQIEGRKRVLYRVARGDSLTAIARHLGVTPAELARWNAILPEATLVSKMVLQAFVFPAFEGSEVVLLDPARAKIMVAGSETFLDLYERRKGRKRLRYTVRPGDNLTRIARRFRISVGSLARINGFGPRTELQVGQQIIVYVEDKRAKPTSSIVADRRRAALAS